MGRESIQVAYTKVLFQHRWSINISVFLANMNANRSIISSKKCVSSLESIGPPKYSAS